MGKSDLRFEALASGPICYLRLYGTINETFNPSELANAANGRDVIINLKAVTRISSFGVRDWVHFMDRLKDKVDRIIFVECSPVIVSSLNMVANFAGTATVVSIQVPYFCSPCGWDAEATQQLDQIRPGEAPSADVQCRRCGAAMEMDADPNSYFSFSGQVLKPPLDPSLKAFISKFASPSVDKHEVSRFNPTAWWKRIRAILAGIPRLRLLSRSRPLFQAGLARVRSHPKIALGIIGGVLLSLIALAWTLTAGPPSIAANELALLHASLDAQRFVQARDLVSEWQATGRAPPELAASFRKQISQRQDRVVAEYRDDILHHASAKRFAQAIAILEEARTLDLEKLLLDPRTMFPVAESYRVLDRMEEAEAMYARYVEAVSSSKPTDPRLDDALFWRADILVKAGKTDKARELYRRVAYKIPKANFRRSALSRLKGMRSK